jgi:predicted nucleotidyltransferase
MTIDHLRRSEPVSSPAASTASVDEICHRVAARVAPIDGINAIALGGSRARATAREDSDIDLAVYYDPANPFAIEELDGAACELDDRHITGLVTQFGAWGAGVNGGGWLLIGGHHVDWLYRDLQRVRTVIEECVSGKIEAFYQLGHPLGFQSQIYVGEIHVCQPLYDQAGELAKLKQLVGVYPPRMRRGLVDKHLFDAQFEIEIAAGPATRGDIVYVSQCIARATGFMVLVLHALNQRFFLNEKNAFSESASFALRPTNFHRELERILARPGDCASALTHSVASMRLVVSELRDFCEEQYPTDPVTGPTTQACQQSAESFKTATREQSNS